MNSYFAILLITIVGSWAVFIIVDVATTDVVVSAMSRSEANYSALRQSILESR